MLAKLLGSPIAEARLRGLLPPTWIVQRAPMGASNFQHLSRNAVVVLDPCDLPPAAVQQALVSAHEGGPQGVGRDNAVHRAARELDRGNAVVRAQRLSLFLTTSSTVDRENVGTAPRLVVNDAHARSTVPISLRVRRVARIVRN